MKNRTIKFRAIYKGKIVGYIDLLVPIPKSKPFPKGGFTASNFGGSYDELNQFTGLLDCHGKEIFEGDILRKKHSSTYGRKAGNFYKTIMWGQSYNRCGFNIGYPVKWEVIGNVYENKVIASKSIQYLSPYMTKRNK